MKKWMILLVLYFLYACQSSTPPVALSAYYWKTHYKLRPVEQSFLKEKEIHKLYIRYCDVGLKNNEPVPIAPIEWREITTLPKEIVPVIYIKNEVFLKPHVDIKDLVQKLKIYVQQISAKAGVQTQHVQFDCDWSLQSKEQFFEFLTEFKKDTQWYLSATIRLHQVKYFEKTGVPPVDHGVLMYYNMGTIAPVDENSIYDRSIAQKYVARLSDYPLHLDVALPIFSWGVQIRDHKVVTVIGGMREQDIRQNTVFKKIQDFTYEITEEYVYKGRLLQKGDRIKIEEVSAKDLQQATKDLSTYIKPREVILYDLDEKNIKYYEQEVFKTIRRGY